MIPIKYNPDQNKQYTGWGNVETNQSESTITVDSELQRVTSVPKTVNNRTIIDIIHVPEGVFRIIHHQGSPQSITILCR